MDGKPKTNIFSPRFLLDPLKITGLLFLIDKLVRCFNIAKSFSLSKPTNLQALYCLFISIEIFEEP